MIELRDPNITPTPRMRGFALNLLGAIFKEIMIMSKSKYIYRLQEKDLGIAVRKVAYSQRISGSDTA